MTALAAPVLSERDFRRVSEIVHAHCGINLHDGKKELVPGRGSRKCCGTAAFRMRKITWITFWPSLRAKTLQT